jgi:hypothetical protein
LSWVTGELSCSDAPIGRWRGGLERFSVVKRHTRYARVSALLLEQKSGRRGGVVEVVGIFVYSERQDADFFGVSDAGCNDVCVLFHVDDRVGGYVVLHDGFLDAGLYVIDGVDLVGRQGEALQNGGGHVGFETFGVVGDGHVVESGVSGEQDHGENNNKFDTGASSFGRAGLMQVVHGFVSEEDGRLRPFLQEAFEDFADG